jgi:hypothetical protein
LIADNLNLIHCSNYKSLHYFVGTVTDHCSYIAAFAVVAASSALVATHYGLFSAFALQHFLAVMGSALIDLAE